MTNKPHHTATIAETTFLANISHELRTPLNGMIGMASLLRESQQTKEQSWYTDMILRAGSSLLGIIDNLLEYSKLESGILVPDLKNVELRTLVFDSIIPLTPQFSQKNISFTIDIEPSLPENIVTDPSHFKQILVNLLGNSLKFTTFGKVKLTIASYPNALALAALSITVTDSGSGISPEYYDTIFDRFTQEDSSMTRKIGGTGMGLALCKMLLALHKGSISLESTKGVGSTFSVLLPISIPEHSFPLSFASDKKLSVLLIADKDSGCAKTIVDYCTYWNITVRRSTNLLALTNHSNFDLSMVCSSIIDTIATPDFLSFVSQTSSRHLAIMANPLHYMEWTELCTIDRTHIISSPISPKAMLTLFETIYQDCSDAPFIALKNRPNLFTKPKSSCEFKRILVVEDNEINQIFVRRALEQHGHAVILASDGQQAIDLFLQGVFDLILMDVQMPIMDGLMATRHIREHEKKLGRRIPILALTASTAVKDWDECFKAGMDGFLSKPIGADELEKRIAPYLNPKKVHEPIPETTPLKVPPPLQEVDSKGPLNYAAMLAGLGNDKDLFHELIDVILMRWPAITQTLANDYDNHDADAIGKTLHTIKGSTTVFGSPLFVPSIIEFMHQARNGTPMPKETVISLMDAEFVHLQALNNCNKER